MNGTIKKPKIIGFDLDDVILGFSDALTDWYTKTYGIYRPRKHIEHCKDWGCTFEESVQIVFDFYDSKEHLRALPVNGAVEALARIKGNNKFYVITARPEITKKQTLTWLNTYLPNTFDGVFFTNQFQISSNIPKRTKSEICRELGIEIFIDDSLNNAEDISKIGIPVLLFDTAWNQFPIETPITRVHSWDEIVSKLT